MNIMFDNINYLYLLLPLLLVLNKNINKKYLEFSEYVMNKILIKKYSPSKFSLLYFIMFYILIIFALAKPYIDNGEIKTNNKYTNVIVALDMSKSMFVEDIYPNRFMFAKSRFKELLKLEKGMRISLLGFSSQTFLISPLTEDKNSLEFLSKNLNVDSYNLKGTSIMTLLKSANDLFLKEDNKNLLLLTDGGDKTDFTDEINYAIKNNIKISIYNIGTKKGGPLKEENGKYIKNTKGSIQILKINPNIKKLAEKTKGIYKEVSYDNSSIKDIYNYFKLDEKSIYKKEITIRDKKELFFYPLLLSLLFLFLNFFDLNIRKNK